MAVEADVTDEDQAHAAVAAAVERFGRLDTVVANAGVMLLGPIVDAPTRGVAADDRAQHARRDVHRARRAAAPARGGGAGAAAGRRPRDHQQRRRARRVRQGSGVYNASKHAVGAFAEALRMEVTQRHVRVSLIEPGAVATELASHNRPEVREAIAQRFDGVRAAGGRRHRPDDRVRGHQPAAHGGQRGADPAHLAGVTSAARLPAATPRTAPPSTSVGQCTRRRTRP